MYRNAVGRIQPTSVVGHPQKRRLTRRPAQKYRRDGPNGFQRVFESIRNAECEEGKT